MMRRPKPLLLLIALVVAPAVVLAIFGAVVVSSATARQGLASFGDPQHFMVRQLISLALATIVGVGVARLGPARMLRAAPYVFVVALLATLAVFVPGIGVRAAGASRWLQLGPVSGNPAPILTFALGLLIAAWGRPPAEGVGRRGLAVAMGFIAVLTLMVEPDFSAAGVALLVGCIALAALGVAGWRLLPAAAALVVALVLVASQFGYVGGRVSGFLTPERDRRGKGFEVLALARTSAAATPTGVGLGKGVARRQLSSPGSDYVYAVITEEMGRLAGAGIAAAWLCIGAGAVLAARGARDRRMAAVALSSGIALVAPAALHVAVCSGWVPIIGVTMPFVSYDPAATVAAGAELGVVAGVTLAQRQT